MKFRRAVAFAFPAGLALAVLAVGTGVLTAQAGSFSAAGEVICGERAAAEGFTLRQELALGGHLSVDAVFDAASGETRSDSAWSFLELAPEEAPAGPKLRLKGVGGDRDESWPDRGHNTLGAPLAWAQGIYDRLYSSLDGESGQAGESRPLSEYTDKLPLNFYCRGMTDDVPVYEIRPKDPRLWCDRRVNETYDGELSDGAFALPLNGDEMLYASVTVNSYASAFGVEASPGDGYYYTYSDCVLAPDGALYLVLDIRETDGGTPGKRVSAEGFPGGEWCVWRIPCEVEVDTGVERRWTADSVRVRPDFGSIECFHALGADWEHADLELSYDGTRLLLFTVADGSLRLTVFGLDGEELQSMKLMDIAPGVDIYTSEVNRMICHVFENGLAVDTDAGEVVCVPENGGIYAAPFVVDMRALPDSLQYGGTIGAEPYAFASDGERVAMLDGGHYFGTDGGRTLLRLTVFAPDGELLYSEQLSTEDTDSMRRDGYELIYTGRDKT